MADLEFFIEKAFQRPETIIDEMSTGEKIAVLFALGAWQTNKLMGSDVIAAFDRMDDSYRKAAFDWYYSHEEGQPHEYYEKRHKFRQWADAWGRGEFDK